MFEYSLYTVFGKDVAWYLDLAGVVVLNGFNFPIFIGCVIGRAMGYQAGIISYAVCSVGYARLSRLY